FGYRAEKRMRQAQALVGLLGRVRDIRRQGAAALDLCDVAAGRLNGYFESGLNPWDQAAGVLVAREAGALVLGGRGAPPDAELGVAAAASVARLLGAALETAES